MFVKNVFRSFRSTHIQELCGGGREEGNFPWVIFTFSKRDSSLILKKLSNTFSLLEEQTPNPPPSTLLPICSLSILPALPYLSFPFPPPSLPACSLYIPSQHWQLPTQTNPSGSLWRCIHRNLQRTRRPLLPSPCVCGVARSPDGVSLQLGNSE